MKPTGVSPDTFESLNATETKIAKLARKDAAVFCEFILKDEKGRDVELGEIHRTWHTHIDWCWANGLKPVILAPWGHGKSVQIAIGRTLYEIGRDRNLRVIIISNDDNNASKRLVAISRYIEKNFEFRLTFPGIKRDFNGEWSKHKLLVERDSISIDPTVSAGGILGTGVGARADLLIFDDPVDERNAITNPGLRKKVISAYSNTWMSRLEPEGRYVYIGTLWHRDDLAHKFLFDNEFQKAYCVLYQEIKADMTGVLTKLFNVPTPEEHPLVIEFNGKIVQEEVEMDKNEIKSLTGEERNRFDMARKAQLAAVEKPRLKID